MNSSLGPKTENPRQLRDFRQGMIHGLPIGLGYLAVSFAFGLFAVEGGLAPLTAAFLSLTNLTSAGQFAGTSLIFARAPWLEIGLTTLLINSRYMLMSLSLSQKIQPGLSPLKRLMIGYGVTDEVYAVAIAQPNELSFKYMIGLISLPVACWTSGALLGGLAGNILPLSVRSALGIALFAMFIAIITPVARQSRPVLLVIILAVSLSILGWYWPWLQAVPLGWRLIGCTVIAALAGALLAPIHSVTDGEEAGNG
jgi:4-azaleucine resistance transporter AzlC